MRQRAWPAYVFLLPWLLGAVTLTLLPMAASLYLSFTDYNLFETPRWVGLANYVELFTQDDRYRTAVVVTLKYVLVSVPLKLLLAFAAALLLNSLRGRGKAFYRSAFYAPSLLGASVGLALAWRSLFDRGGAVPSLLGQLGISTPSWVDDPDWALWAVVLLSAWQFGAPMVIFLAGLQQIPPDLLDAAAVDGAGWWRRLVSVVFPVLSPVIFFNLVLEAIHAFQAFTSAFIISSGRGGPADATLFYTLYLYERGFGDFRMGYAAAMAWILLLVIALVTALLFRSARRWVFYGDDLAGR
ncbi:carbohydrate ABC transporter permease [Crossiella cryophila]|uniref:Multiple sugar transport system permease protein n=1 Tax=Crossiella cryophila TaxID=43355 RepID=A0A7W7CK23_9PSEU|nr:sugar ABC transporter permease [Crossiella cryophila]MBB4681241.1 multiple sugar transport system permease protein [Crossiella cryophila]